MKRILLFAGTTEGRILAERLAALPVRTVVSVATEYGRELLAGLPANAVVATGRMDAGQMAEMMRRDGFDLVIDATHPYAVEVSENIRRAAAGTGCRLLRLRRSPGGGAGCEYCASVREAAERLGGREGNVLIATGAKELDAYTVIPGFAERMYPRVLPAIESIRRCEELGFRRSHIIAMQGPFGRALNRALMEQFAIRHMVTKDGGDAGGFPDKMLAADDAGVAVLVVGRPVEQQGGTLGEILGAVEREAEGGQ